MTPGGRRSIIRDMQKLREWLNLTQVSVAELADEIDASRQTVYNWLDGTSQPTGIMLRRLHERTRIPLDDLVPRDSAA